MPSLPTRHRAVVVLAAAASVVALSSCSTGSSQATDTPEPQAGNSAEPDAFPVTIEHAFGETEIEAEPERVVAVGYSEADFVLSLGVVPVGATQILYGGNENQSTRWFDEELATVEGAEQPSRFDETDGTPVAAIVELEPDLVLASNSGMTEDEYDQLTEAGIPVVAYPEAPYTTPWAVSLDMVGDALGRPTLADEVEAETLASLAETNEEFPQLEGTSFVFGGPNSADVSSFYVYTPQDNRPRILTELGMVNPDFVTETSEDGQFLFELSAERAGELESDVFLTYATSEQEVAELGSNPLLQQIPAVASGNWYASVDESEALGLSAPSPLSIPDAMERYIPRVAAAVDGDGS